MRESEKIKERLHTHKTVILICGGMVLFMLFYLLLQTTFPFTPVTPPAFRTMMWIIGLTLITAFIITCVIVHTKKIVLHRLAAVLIPVVGLLYIIMIPFYTVPDEDMHISMTYHFTNLAYGIDQPLLELHETREIQMRADDARYYEQVLSTYNTLNIKSVPREEYVRYWQGFFHPLQDGSLETMHLHVASGKPEK